MDRLFTLLDRYFEKILIRILTAWLEAKLRPKRAVILSVSLTPIPGNPMAIKSTFDVSPVLETDGVTVRELAIIIDGSTSITSFGPADVIFAIVPQGSNPTATVTNIDAAGNRAAPSPDFTYSADVPDTTAPEQAVILGVTNEVVPD